MPLTLNLATLCPSTTPSYDGTGKTLTPNAKRIKYGDDYETRIARSINKSNSEMNISYGSLLISEAQALEDWLEDTRGVKAFNVVGASWIDSSVLYVYVSLNRAPSKPSYDTITVKLDRVFA